MFIPVEPALLTLYNEAEDLIEKAWQKKIIIVGPSTLPFLLKAVENMWRIDKQSKTIKDMNAVSLHIPLTYQNKNIINYNLLKTMKKNCIIINAARGGIINEKDLDKALNENLIFGAGIDVFEVEPPEADNPLLKNDKVFLSPHAVAFTEECMTRMAKETIQNIFDFFDGKLEDSKKVKLQIINLQI